MATTTVLSHSIALSILFVEGYLSFENGAITLMRVCMFEAVALSLQVIDVLKLAIKKHFLKINEKWILKL